MPEPKTILISRTDSIGDVILTLPMAAVLKQHFPDARVLFLGKEYTRPVINACVHVDAFIEPYNARVFGEKPDTIIHVLPVKKIAFGAKRAHIPVRIGTTNRIFHWFTCNRLVKLSRRNSDLHEAQLNLKLLQPLGITREFPLEESPAVLASRNCSR